MQAKVVFKFNGEVIGEYPFSVPSPESFGIGIQSAINEFRRKQPMFDLMADGFVLAIEKVA